jgi:hypothetical protein
MIREGTGAVRFIPGIQGKCNASTRLLGTRKNRSRQEFLSMLMAPDRNDCSARRDFFNKIKD